jgi:undecaprenyl-diphosphatase
VKIVPNNFREINFRALKLEIWIWILVGMILFFVAKFWDTYAFTLINMYFRSPYLDTWIVFLTEKAIWWILGAFGIIALWRTWNSEDKESRLLPAFFSIVIAAITAAILKSWFDVPRPFLELELIPLVQQRIFDSSGLPSLHTAVAFAALVPLWRIYKILGIGWALFAIVIGVSRIYENVHWPSDIVGGFVLGGTIGAIISNKETVLALKLAWQQLEFRRQSLHFFSGFLIVFAHWIGVLRLREIAVLLLIGLVTCWLTARGNLPWLANFLRQFDRPRAYDFPGSGAFYFLLGTGVVFLFFPVKIAYAAVLILAVGDSFNNLFAERLPKSVNLPWNRRKSITGVTLGIIAGTFAAQFFVPLWAAFLACCVAIGVESYPWRVGKFFVDDNILVPLSAGAVLFLLV